MTKEPATTQSFEGEFRGLQNAIDAAVDTSVFGGFAVGEHEGGHNSKFRCDAAREFLDALGLPATERTDFLKQFSHEARGRNTFIAFNLLCLDAMSREDYPGALLHANKAFALWQHDNYNHQLILKCKARIGAVAEGFEDSLSEYLDECFCPRPFEHFETTYNNQVYLCSPDYLTAPAADLSPLLTAGAKRTGDDKALDAVAWNTPAAREIRRSIIAGQFEHCSALTCPAIQGRYLPKREQDASPLARTEDPHLVQTDYLGHDIYYLRSRVYAVATGRPLTKAAQRARDVLVSYSLDDLARLVAERAGVHDAAGDVDRTWFVDNGLAQSVVLAPGDAEQTRARERMSHSPRELMMTHDNSCNISCPSCRKSTIIASRKETEQYDQLVPVFLDLLGDADRLIVSGSGDPFASRHFRRLLRAIGGQETEHYGEVRYPRNFRINLMTNGMLLNRKTYEEFGLRGLIGMIALSMDSCEKESFERIRRGSRWQDLMEALKFVQVIRQENANMVLISYFTVQAENYRQLPEFIEFCRRYRFHHIQLNMIRNFGAYSPDEFAGHNIGDPKHPEFNDFLEIMRDPALLDPVIMLGNAKDYFDLATSGVAA